MNSEDLDSPYCPICESCGEDGCCPATVCKQHLNGKYCETNLKELKFAYLCFHDILKLLDGDDKYENRVDELYDKNWDIIFGEDE